MDEVRKHITAGRLRAQKACKNTQYWQSQYQ